MDVLIKKLLRENNGMVIFHDGDKEYAKNIDSINKIEFQRLESRGLSAYVIFKNKRLISSFEKVNTPSELKKYKDINGRIDVFYLTEEQANKSKKIIDKTNEIIELKYHSIELISKHAIAAINEYYKKTNERDVRDN